MNSLDLKDKKVFIHIGFPETVTPFFQNNVFPSLRTSYFINTHFCTYFHGFNLLEFYDDVKYDKEVIIRELSKIQSNKILISHEGFVGDLIRRSLIASRLSGLFPNAKIIMFIRGQFDILRSVYNSFTKTQGYKGSISNLFFIPDENYKSYSLEDYEASKKRPFEEKYVDSPGIHLDNYNYFDLIWVYKKYFKDINVFLYEDFKFHPEKVLKDIQKLLDDSFDTYTNQIMNKNQNVSVSSDKIKNTISNDSLLKRNFLMFKSGNKNAPRRSVARELFEEEHRAFFKSIDDRKYYSEGNKKLIEYFPEIGIQNYKEQYQQ